MTFLEAIAAIPFNPTGDQATGLLAPIMRAVGHILYVIGALAEPNYTLTSEEVQRELTDASAHLAGTLAVVDAAPLSSPIKVHIDAFISAVDLARADYADWPEDDRGANLTALANAAAALAAEFDAELAGVEHSNPGRTL